MRNQIAAFVCSLFLGFLTWAFYKMAIARKEEEEEELYPFSPASSSTLLECSVFACLFAIGFFLYSVGLWDIIGDALYKWLAPNPYGNVMMHHQ